VQVLQRPKLRFPARAWREFARSGVAAASVVMQECCSEWRAANGFFVVERFGTSGVLMTRSIFRFQPGRRYWAAFIHLKTPRLRFRREQGGGRAASATSFEPERPEFPCQVKRDGRLSRSFTLRKTVPLRGRRCPERAVPGECLPIGSRDTITSPVERIPGPRIVSTPRNLLNGKTGRLDGVKIVHCDFATPPW